MLLQNQPTFHDGQAEGGKELGLREDNKQFRRQLIIDAAEHLIGETGSTNFTMHDLARQAGLSPHTTYNLIGSKSTVLYILLNRCLDRIVRLPDLPNTQWGAMEYIFKTGDAGMDVFTANPRFYRPLLRFLFGVVEETHRPAYMSRAYQYWHRATMVLQDAGLLRDGIKAEDLARDINIFITGVMEFWIHDELDNDGLRAQICHGIALRLLSLGIEEFRPRLIEELTKARAVIEPFRLRNMGPISSSTPIMSKV